MVGLEPTRAYTHKILSLACLPIPALPQNVPTGIRTPDTRLRRPLLYPTELQTLKRVMGIEPTYPAWKAGVLPLNYTRIVSDTDVILSHVRENCNYFFDKLLRSTLADYFLV